VFVAGGLAELLLAVTRVDLNPLSVSLNVFVIAITTEFAVLVYLRYLRERGDRADAAADESLADDYRAALRATGPALFASAVTALAGFATLAVSNINLLRGFAIVAVIDLAAALAGALLVLPLAIRWVRQSAAALARRRTAGEALSREPA
jgi:predicted RND superfamily exporter protein